MPIDAHGWYALIAPRPCLIHTAHNDGAEGTFAVEKAYLQGREVYRFLDAEEHLRVDYRTGGHRSGPATEPISPADRARNLDWIDLSFGRGAASIADFPETLLHDFDWDAWRARQNEADLDRRSGRPGRRPGALAAGRGTGHPAAGQPAGVPDRGRIQPHDPRPLGARGRQPRADPLRRRRARQPVFPGRAEHSRPGGDLAASVLLPSPATTRATAWRAPPSIIASPRTGSPSSPTTSAASACACWKAPHFYENHPRWSRLGRMVRDARAAISFAIDGTGTSQSAIPPLDGTRVYLLGYSAGALTALHTAALDDRIAGTACFAGWTPHA